MRLHQLSVSGQHSPELLERILRVMRHRGFSVQNLQMHLDPSSQLLHLDVAIESARPITLLTAQLDKLIGVSEVILINRVAEPKLALV